MTLRLLILLVVLFASPALAQQTAKAQGVISVANNTPPPPGQGWTDFSGVQLPNGHCPPNPAAPGQPGACPGVVNAWNGAIVDTFRNRLWVCDAGGHNDYGGNECYYFDPVAGTVVRANDPTTGVVQSTAAAYPDGRPSSRHGRV